MDRPPHGMASAAADHAGGQAWYSDVAIELVLTLRLVFHLGLGQAEGFSASVMRLLGQDLRVPDHSPTAEERTPAASRDASRPIGLTWQRRAESSMPSGSQTVHTVLPR